MTFRQRRNARRFSGAARVETVAGMAAVTKENTSGKDPGESEWLAS